MSAVEVQEVTVGDGEDPEMDALDEITGGRPYVMVVVDISDPEGMGFEIKCGGGVSSSEMIRAILDRASRLTRENLA